MDLINCKGKIINLSSPKVMGILNYTPDSFSDGNVYNTREKSTERIEQMLEDGADIIDIGAISSRPGADLLSLEEEKRRLEPVLSMIPKMFPDTIFSLDTFRAEVAKWAVEKYGIAIINDISSGMLDKLMFKTVAELQVPYILMHMQGKPDTMQKNPDYQNITEELLRFFAEKISLLKELGVKDIIIDPGFGFGKTLEHNYQILKDLSLFKILEKPILVGVSRKTMIQQVLDCSPLESDNGTTIVNTISVLKGAGILRVHDVKKAKELIKITKMLDL